MTRRTNVWWVAAIVTVLFMAVNLGGAWIAALRGELLHAGIHVALLVLGAYPAGVLWRIAPRRVAR